MKKEHRIVFLDLDQVLYDYQTRTVFDEPDKTIVEYRVVTEAVCLLATTLAEMGAEIVFITSWSEDKIRHELYNDLQQLAPHTHNRIFVDERYRRSDRMTGIQQWIEAEYDLNILTRMEAVKLNEPIELEDGSHLRFAIIDDSTGLYTLPWAQSRLVPVVNQRFGNFENQLLKALLSGEDIKSSVTELHRRHTILYRSCAAIRTGMGWENTDDMDQSPEEE